MVEPEPRHVPQVLAIWNPLSITKVFVPVPLHDPQGTRLAPCLRPVPAHVEHVDKALTFTLRVVPLQASKNETLMRASMSAPLALWLNPERD